MIGVEAAMEWKGMTTPCIVAGSKGLRFGSNFTIRAHIKCEIIGGKQTIFAKRVPIGTGNRPGVILMLHGSCIELKLFEDGGKKWSEARTWSNIIRVGQRQEVLAFRAGDKAKIYIDGIDRTNPKYEDIATGDANCDSDAFIGMQIYNNVQPKEPFYGKIYMLGVYQDTYYGAASPVVFQKNPNVVALSQLPEVAERFGIPRV